MAAEHFGFSGELWGNGPSPGGFYSTPGGTTTPQHGPTKHTLHPMTMGTSVLGVKFDGGVVVAADMLGSYGSLARYRNISRVMKVNNTTVLAGAGDYADYQFLKEVLDQKIIDDELLGDGHSFSPKAIFSWLTRVMYNRRTRFNPLWNQVVIGGFNNGEPFLGYVDKIGVAYEAPTIATGMGAYMAQPLLRDALEKKPNMSQSEALELLERCLKVLFYRDARSFNKFEFAIVTAAGVEILQPRSAEANWSIAHLIKGYE
ncbi:proteasome subunit beta type-4-like [Branchiostoma floridae]|uniref:Proteasome subunit beta n=1 Tax=Branchiostoma floridae TaxID=7739 RepID=C3YDQ6_BRAFL|nr:proteasome subunit beta type-4-like [Branchiostoma floridae]|eukprot:XP_002605515.1 hypothetical protein BRAFLDRAFT_286692 [Branchiostoma floridae]